MFTENFGSSNEVYKFLQKLHHVFLFWIHRAYGSVYKALHKESGEVLAIKQVPVDTDLQEIIKEISIMQQCDRFVDTKMKYTQNVYR